MDATVSISKGVFVFKNGATSAKSTKKLKAKKSKNSLNSLLDTSITNAPWYQAYDQLWQKMYHQIEALQQQSYDIIFTNLLQFISSNSLADEETIGTAVLLTGINQIDHLEHFIKLGAQISEKIEAVTVILEARNCSNIKSAIETLIQGLVSAGIEEDEEEFKLKKHQLNMSYLLNWYNTKYIFIEEKPCLIVMIPDFEAFQQEILQKLILILHGHRLQIPFIFVFGVASSIRALHDALPFNVTNKITVEVFQSEASPISLNRIIDEILLTPSCPFHLSGRTFRLLTDIFLFYDFSVHGFIQGFKYCMMEHFYQGNIYALCSNDLDCKNIISNFEHHDLEEIRRLFSFRRFVESKSPQVIIKLLTDDEYLKNILYDLIVNLRRFWVNFHCAMEFIHELNQDLPKVLFGKHLRDLYSQCISSDLTESPEFKELLQLLTFLSKNELLDKLTKMQKITKKYSNEEFSGVVSEFHKILNINIHEISNASMENVAQDQDMDSSLTLTPNMGRFELKEKLLQAAKQPKSISPYTKAVNSTIDEIKHFLTSHLKPISKAPPLIELFVFMDSLIAKRHIMGVPRAAIHTALNNPAHYLQCKCCELSHEASLIPTMPDLSIVYKLHLECGKMINMFDWLQSFKVVVDEQDHDDDDEENDDRMVDLKIQARFTRAVAELQFLGYIKASKKKTDHVQRLTW